MRIFDFLRRRREPSSSDVARERLQLVLSYDRAQISPGLLDTLKDEIIAAISRHVEIDAEGVVVTFTDGMRESRLEAQIPLRSTRRRRRRG